MNGHLRIRAKIILPISLNLKVLVFALSYVKKNIRAHPTSYQPRKSVHIRIDTKKEFFNTKNDTRIII
jgi:hypothetical protein